ncbi:hypothetical protein IVB25_16600 [Bradyrhizobium sp. 193]|uniref:hypothetical protein n=1 Tax=unclassified Bradyrhizobium TaxID=2631580 RepID=UPI001FF7ED7F|nr:MULTISPECIES: hypothetical protein [unclassified Bradyrhizobium]MCK1345039.1 hypothetical protein [Bradyrhizobium sp. CW11]MCK1484287.1 hypothetical protein [Bradyrhizobium sp. 193]MCK1707507.1 hypothetical protein [Bradyrhizobium sp. 146]
MGRTARSTKPAKPLTVFARLFQEAYQWAADNGKLDRGRHETSFGALCGTDVRNIRRWRFNVLPKRGNWETARNRLAKIGLDQTKLEALERAWSEPNAAGLESTKAAPDGASATARPVQIIPDNRFPKLCSVSLEIPEQGTSRDDFIVTGEVRFGRAPDVIDGKPVTIGIRRAVLLPASKYCHVKPASLYRPPCTNAAKDEGAEQIIFQANGDDPEAVLDGDQLQGQTLARFVATGGSAAGSPEVNVFLQLETVNDLRVVLNCEMRGRSAAQKKLAQMWIALQVARTVRETDGSLRIGACELLWRDET